MDPRGGFEDRKKAKMNQVRQRYNDIALRNSSTIAGSMKRRTELMEEENASQAFSSENCETEEDRLDRAEFLRLTRKDHLKRLRESLLESDSNNAMSNLTVPSLPHTNLNEPNGITAPIPSPPSVPGTPTREYPTPPPLPGD